MVQCSHLTLRAPPPPPPPPPPPYTQEKRETRNSEKHEQRETEEQTKNVLNARIATDYVFYTYIMRIHILHWRKLPPCECWRAWSQITLNYHTHPNAPIIYVCTHVYVYVCVYIYIYIWVHAYPPPLPFLQFLSFCTLSALDVFILCAKTPTAPTSQSFEPMNGTKPQPHQRTNVPIIWAHDWDKTPTAPTYQRPNHLSP